MGTLNSFLTRLVALLLCPLVSAIQVPLSGGSPQLKDSYDYVIVGAGVGGLVVANRLTEDPSVSVLVIEVGQLDDEAEDVTVPGNVGHEDPHRYEVALDTTAQEFLDNTTRTFNQGRAVGGSTITNGLCWTRGAAADYDAWEALGNPGWGWADMLPYFLKSESYSAPSDGSLKGPQHISPVIKAHGNHGPVEVGYPNYIYNQTYNFFAAIMELGIPWNEDINSGTATGASLIPSSMTAKNQSRSDARTAYLDPVLSRPNLELLTGFTATRLWQTGSPSAQNATWVPGDSGVVVTGVEFAANETAPRHTIACRREVILAAGAIFSPVLLQLSGFGPADLLESLNVTVAVDLPGVGSNLQDHPMVQPVYEYTSPDILTAWDIYGSVEETVRKQYLANRTGPWTAPMVNTIAFPALDWVREDAPQFLNGLSHTRNQLPSSYESTLRAGYRAQERILVSLLSNTSVPAYEIMSTSWGQLAVSVMHSFSRGTVSASTTSTASSSIFSPPHIDPRFCSHAFDCALLLAALQFNDRLISTEAMAALRPVPQDGFAPAQARNRTALDEAMRRLVRTEFHCSGTTAMLPVELGGVVDAELRVYGTLNLRVVDAGVIPLVPAGHIQAAVYAIAEKAADIIKQENWVRPAKRPRSPPHPIRRYS
ncbi:hypothetical protein F4780DRAFT_778767 [Xylariomycetidae sp. FL0641]|nr:hypothetical protein F4780DRAFT_778767 [Xylariomycetidae sp. FL0641]